MSWHMRAATGAEAGGGPSPRQEEVLDAGSGLIGNVRTTPTNVNETVVVDALVGADARVVWADAAYHTHSGERRLKAQGIKARLMAGRNKHHPELPPRLKCYNRLTSATWKRRMGLTAIPMSASSRASAQTKLTPSMVRERRPSQSCDRARSEPLLSPSS